MPTSLLSDARLRATRPGTRPRKVFDGGGLYLLVKPNGARLWRLKYQFAGVEKLLALGAYPEVALRRAREKRDEARQLLDRQIDPGAQRKAMKQAATDAKDNTFSAIAEEWFTHYVQERNDGQRPLATPLMN